MGVARGVSASLRASPAPGPAPPHPGPAPRLGGARACGRGRVGKDRWRDPEARLARPPPPWPPAPTRSARLSHDQGDPHLQQPREAAALQVLPALREYPAAAAAADAGEGELWAAGSALRATPSGTRGPSRAPAASRSWVASLRVGVSRCPPPARSLPPTWLCLGGSSARLLPEWFPAVVRGPGDFPGRALAGRGCSPPAPASPPALLSCWHPRPVLASEEDRGARWPRSPTCLTPSLSWWTSFSPTGRWASVFL